MWESPHQGCILKPQADTPTGCALGSIISLALECPVAVGPPTGPFISAPGYTGCILEQGGGKNGFSVRVGCWFPWIPCL